MTGKLIKKILGIVVRIILTCALVRINKYDWGVDSVFSEILLIAAAYGVISYFVMIVRVSICGAEEEDEIERKFFRKWTLGGAIGKFAGALFALVAIVLAIVVGIPALIGLVLPESIKMPVQMALCVMIMLFPVIKDIYDLLKIVGLLDEKYEELKVEDCNVYGPNEDMTFEEYQKWLSEKK